MSKATLHIVNNLTRQKEVFTPINDGFVGMYVCGPTVYSDVHLGNCRTFVSFDIMYRYLLYLGYKVRYVRNITDVGHLLDDGEDRMAKGAKAEQLQPMEVAQKYANGFHHMMQIFNTKRPSIEPRATGHIIEQIEMVQQIIDNGFGYEANGSVYFDTLAYAKEHPYGELSGRVIDELKAESRDLKKQGDKKHPSDFAIWMKADDSHIMKWESPWSLGFPGWHLECSAMSTKYLGETFDIHGGGNDLKFPHHENEIAQNKASCGCTPARYWVHTNMLLMNGKKMSKSDGNTITPQQLFSGESEHITKGYSPMVVKFFMLQCHYNSTLDLTDGGLQAAEKGYYKLMDAYRALTQLTSTSESGSDDEKLNGMLDTVVTEMSDDFNTPKALAKLFELVTEVNKYKENISDIRNVGSDTLDKMKKIFFDFLFDIFGLTEPGQEGNSDKLDGLMSLVIDLRAQARDQKDWPTSDLIRDQLAELNIVIKDGKDGTNWTVKNS